MNMEEKNEKEKALESVNSGNHAKAILPMRIALFVTLLLLCAGAAFIVGLYDYDGSFQQMKNGSKEEYFASKAFENVLQSWSRQMCSYMHVNSYVKSKDEVNADTKLYSVTEYSEVAKSKLFDEGAMEESKLPAKDVSFSELKKKNTYAADRINDGVDCGEQDFLFYNTLRDNLNNLTDKVDTKSFVHLDGHQFYSLLEKYCTDDTLKQESIQGEFAEELERFAYVEDDETDETELTDYEYADPDGDENTTVEKFSYDNKYIPKGFYNSFNHNFIIYSYYGGNDGEGHFLLKAGNSTYDYAMNDVPVSGDFYIPASLLDYSSRKNFEKSLITTPFTTVETVMAYLGMQSYITDRAHDRWNDSYNYATLNEFDYVITYLDEDNEEQVLMNSRESRFDGGKVLVYDQTKGTVTTNIEGVDFSGNNEIFESFKEYDKIKKVELRMDANFGFNTVGIMYLISLASVYIDTIWLVLVLLIILAIVLFVGMIYIMPAKVYQRDQHFFLTKTIVYGAVFGIFVSLFVAFLYFLCDIGMHFFPAIRLTAIIIAFVFLLGVAYIAMTEYFFSIIRLVKAKQFKKYLFLYRVYAKTGKTVKNFFHNIRQFFAEIWRATGYAKRAVIKRVALLIGVLGCAFWMMAFGIAGVGILCLFFFFGLCAVLVLEAFDIHHIVIDQKMLDNIMDGIEKLTDGDLSSKIDTETMKGDKKKLAEMINHIGDGFEKAVAQSIKDERLKAELITNVSHDIKTPLTSIINYVDLMKREHVSEEPLKGYIEVLEQKSQRLKQLTEDLVEASKASTGNIELEPVNLNMTELLSQTIGEFEDKFSEKNLTLVPNITEEEVVIFADGRRCYRIFENLFQNIYKYAMPNTRVYLSLELKGKQVVLCLKNISESPLTVDVSELTGRFVRGDVSRTTEGSGLGLSIAQSLTTLQNGSFHVELDGDLFKVTIIFERQEKQEL